MKNSKIRKYKSVELKNSQDNGIKRPNSEFDRHGVDNMLQLPFLEEREKKKTGAEAKKDLDRRVQKALFSFAFINVLLISSLKLASNFAYGWLFKEIGMHYIKDDFIVSFLFLIANFLNLFVRFAMGFIIKSIGLKYTYIFNLVLQIISSSSAYFYKETVVGIGVWLFFNRFGSGSLYILNYVSCVEVWGKDVGLGLMKYFDSIYFIGNVLDCIMMTTFQGVENYGNIILTCLFCDIILIFPSLLIKKQYVEDQEENED